MTHHAALVSPHCYYSLFICYKINAPFQVQNKQQQQQKTPISGVVSKELCWSQIFFPSATCLQAAAPWGEGDQGPEAPPPDLPELLCS